MNKFYTQTLIPMPNIDYKSIWPNSPTDTSDSIPRWRTYTDKTGLWENEVIKKLEFCELTPYLIRIFRWMPKTVFPWHTDGTSDLVTPFAINWLCEGVGAIQWDSKIELPKPEEHYSRIAFGTKIGAIDDHFEEITLGHGCIVNTAIPHRVLNMNKIHRITISIEFGKKLNYEQAVERLINVGLA
jgi:hypothetical protein